MSRAWASLPTPTDFDTLRALAEKAPEGPWFWGGNTDSHGDVGLHGRSSSHGVIDILRLCSEHVTDEDLKAEYEASEFIADYMDLEEYIQDRRDHPRDELAFIEDAGPDGRHYFVVPGRERAVYEVARNQGLPDDTPRDHPKVYRADVVDLRNDAARYLAAADPTTILALLDRIEELEQQVAEHAYDLSRMEVTDG